MTTQIVPVAGNGVLWTQQGVGTTPGYTALDLRRSESGSLQEGVYGTTSTVTAGGVAGTAYADFMVTQRNAGANMSVDINMPAGGGAWVQGDTIDGQGLYYIPVHGSTINEAIATADSSNPRVDIAILEVLDNVHDASGGNLARVRILTGTPSVGATLDSPTGRPVVPGSALLLADILVPASDTTIGNAQIRDRRKWARGARLSIERATNAGGGSNYTTTSGTLVDLDTTNVRPRIECSGAPMRITWSGILENASAALATLDIYMDGASTARRRFQSLGASGDDQFSMVVDIAAPTAGSHLFSPRFSTGAGTLILYAQATNVMVLTIEEKLSANAANSTVTSG